MEGSLSRARKVSAKVVASVSQPSSVDKGWVGGSVARMGVDVGCCAYIPIVESFSISTVPAYASPPPMDAVMDDGSDE